ncbi:MAG: hypothetical protein ABIT01_02055 [Thermoanaerobaculia bacterium]
MPLAPFHAFSFGITPVRTHVRKELLRLLRGAGFPPTVLLLTLMSIVSLVSMNITVTGNLSFESSRGEFLAESPDRILDLERKEVRGPGTSGPTRPNDSLIPSPMSKFLRFQLDVPSPENGRPPITGILSALQRFVVNELGGDMAISVAARHSGNFRPSPFDVSIYLPDMVSLAEFRVKARRILAEVKPRFLSGHRV